MELVFKEKGLESRIVYLIKELQNDKIYVAFIRLDDAGENYALEKACKQQKFESQTRIYRTSYASRNEKVERKFQTQYGRIRAMMNDLGIEGEFRNGLWAECAATGTYYENYHCG